MCLFSIFCSPPLLYLVFKLHVSKDGLLDLGGRLDRHIDETINTERKTRASSHLIILPTGGPDNRDVAA